jgi:signal transduction histidine kinase
MRQPLRAIARFAERFEEELPAEDPAKAEAALVVREVQKLEDLLAREAKKVAAGAPRLAVRQLNEIVHESVLLLREELMGRGVFLEETYSDQIPELLLDGERIRHVMVNILQDSLDAVRDGDTIRIETLRDGDRVLLEVANTGQQAPGEILERLFVPFSVARPAGKGLGLAIAQQIIQEHGGEISVRSEGEWRAIFTVSLPVRENQERRGGKDRRGGRDRRDRKGDEAA